MKEITKLGIMLLVIASISAVVLGFTNEITKPIIQAQAEQASNKARAEILPAAKEFEEVSGEDFGPVVKEVYKGIDGETVGYTIKTVPTSGYGGAIEVTVGISADGKITGVNIGSHAETPGLGAKASGEFKDQYTGKAVEKEIEVIKAGSPQDNQIVAISGATITSNAVTEGVNEAIRVFNEVLQ
ncbi:electron transport complex protein RnfG [Peptoclostridium litorale DSM 5388]|uniref:Ion-translocating oxidoreductase complex subunit G n=1 Tax=Peptoclostridium litorale DSM 5388 TaxID=1121324 RepID=A0A069RAG1_PEPLI|nr:RnfABCDGE type electron transport complex subunit G [Peptoclostridium litorale]KDR94054.1 electron transport complex protein RnfG [Peptoclostridium litorale DSM 5388]SIN80223.1 electron transport complex protein RnfG [Peptoclostridium litorale DSM 5388]